MIELKENSEGYVSAYINDILITKQGHNNEDSTFSNDDDILISLEEFGNINISEFPNNFGFFMMKNIPKSNFLITRIDRMDNNLDIEITADSQDFNESLWNPNAYFKRFNKINTEFTIEKINISESDYSSIILKYTEPIISNTLISELLVNALNSLYRINHLIELELKGFKWKDEYQKSELLFCNEVLTPLFRKMDLKNLEFTHGIAEHGKDYVFSEYTKFGTLRHSAIQVKAGNLDGKTLSNLREIIAQLEDAFTIPYTQVNEAEKKYIDTFYIITSGKITSIAIEKIKHKIKAELRGSVKFLDKNAILNLVEQYWK